MTRYVSSSLQAQSEETFIAARMLADIAVTSGTMYVCTGRNFIYTRGNTYSPIGNFGGIERIQEDSEPFPRAVRGWLSAVASYTSANSSIISSALQEQLFNKEVKLYMGFLDPDTMTMPNTPEERFKGRITAYTFKPMDPERGPHFEIEVESRLLQRMNASYFNKESYWTTLARSGDTFFNLVPKVPGATAKWGQENSVVYGTLVPLPNIPWYRNPNGRP